MGFFLVTDDFLFRVMLPVFVGVVENKVATLSCPVVIAAIGGVDRRAECDVSFTCHRAGASHMQLCEE